MEIRDILCVGDAKGRPELTDRVRAKVSSLDLSGYGDSMQPLIRRDAERLLQWMKGT